MRTPILLCVLLSLTACMTAPSVITGDAAREAGSLTHWSARGRIGITSPEQSGSGAFTWQQQANGSDVSLRGPAGMGGLNISLQGSSLTLTASDGSRYDTHAALAELEQRLGVGLPIKALSYWLRGLPATDSAAGTFEWRDASHTQLSQSGWDVHFEEWSVNRALRLPTRITLQHDAARVVVRVQEWHVDE